MSRQRRAAGPGGLPSCAAASRSGRVGKAAVLALLTFALTVALTFAFLTPSPAHAEPPPEPDGYRMDAYRAPVPATLAGARVLDTEQAAALWRAQKAAFVDVLPRPPRPANLPAGTVWRDQPRPSIPGAMWLPNTGFGALSEETEAYLRAGLGAATRGDVNAPLVIFCQRECWMSWNAAKRAIAYGYRDVSWFPEGTEGWAAAGLPLEPVEPHP
ncbi:PQQ-dependent catabolism-associated CXXCW motif protein [Xanthobacter sp. KR7-65]|uniref:PQQ-dependent catabolism-associated CXXCW motif protein n=1 Tax=Xanthobacter sp. KR7-65 TaxID=3156612 RepID=UPI0032B4AF0B